mgnify:CR=1 FL=1
MLDQADSIDAEHHHKYDGNHRTDGGDQIADTLREKGQQKVYLQMIVMADRNGNPQKDTINHQVDGKLFAPGLCMAEAITHDALVHHDQCDGRQQNDLQDLQYLLQSIQHAAVIGKHRVHLLLFNSGRAAF